MSNPCGSVNRHGIRRQERGLKRAPFTGWKESIGDQGQELEEEHGEEATAEDAEGEASGEAGQALAAHDVLEERKRGEPPVARPAGQRGCLLARPDVDRSRTGGQRVVGCGGEV